MMSPWIPGWIRFPKISVWRTRVHLIFLVELASHIPVAIPRRNVNSIGGGVYLPAVKVETVRQKQFNNPRLYRIFDIPNFPSSFPHTPLNRWISEFMLMCSRVSRDVPPFTWLRSCFRGAGKTFCSPKHWKLIESCIITQHVHVHYMQWSLPPLTAVNKIRSSLLPRPDGNLQP
jgi:hypothetical protein